MVKPIFAIAACALGACTLDPPPRESFACGSGGPCARDASVPDSGNTDGGASSGCSPSAAPALAQIAIIVDSTINMSTDIRSEPSCDSYAERNNNGSFQMDRLDRVVAALVGCDEPGGVIARWINAGAAVSVLSFGSGENRGRLLAGFGNTSETVAGTLLALYPADTSGAADAFRLAALQLDTCFNAANSDSAVPNGIILLTAGSFSASTAYFDFACDGVSIGTVRDNELPRAADYLYSHDILCAIEGGQYARTFAIGVSGPPFLMDIAAAGDGTYREAGNVAAIREALEAAFSDLLR